MISWVRTVSAAGGRATGFVRRRASGLPLLPTVLLAVAGGVGVAVVAELLLNHVIHVNTQTTAPIDVTKLAFAAVAGIGGVVALVVSYRRQRDIEQGRFVERFGAAAAQLGASDVAVRIAGVYAMAGVADEAAGLRRQQQCIDVLCGYLRLPYTPDLGANHQTKHVQKHTGTEDVPDTEDHFDYRQNDKEVRQTIVRVIVAHLQRSAEYSWSVHDFDFRTAHLEDADFTGATFRGDVRFRDATFSGAAWFRKTRFSRDARFGEAMFDCDVLFDEARFTGAARFNSATFAHIARFDGATFSGGARFDEATFADATFINAKFGSKQVTFTNPKQWGPPPPKFDWEANPSIKPSNVEPQDWPPVIIADFS